jgi:N-acetylglucosamine kinase-like BadF-type ATPase
VGLYVDAWGGLYGFNTTLERSIQAAKDQAGDPDLSLVLSARLAMNAQTAEAIQIVGRMMPYARLIAENEDSAWMATVTFGGPGVTVIAGVGSIAFGRCPEGREVKIGGWGREMGDEGGGYWIARQALSAITKAADGRAEATQLTSLLLRHWRAPNLTGLHQKLQAGEIDPLCIASAAAKVGQAARDGDAVARRLLRHAGYELGHMAATALRRLGMENSPATVGAAGGVFQAGASLLEPFTQMLHQTAPQAQVVRPRLPPVLGALALAFADLEIPLTPELIARLETAAPPLEAT